MALGVLADEAQCARLRTALDAVVEAYPGGELPAPTAFAAASE